MKLHSIINQRIRAISLNSQGKRKKNTEKNNKIKEQEIDICLNCVKSIEECKGTCKLKKGV